MRVTFIAEHELAQLVSNPECALACDDAIYQRRKAALDEMVKIYLLWKVGLLPAELLFGNLMLPKGLAQRL
ncbi:MAG: hypothetical protein IT290_08455 [Deltaproteobacteria bacterium]|nr:hypothetical protein [Deltaproteobacteria bacterium]